MMGTRARTTRRFVALAAVGVLVLSLCTQGACVLAQPSGEIPQLPVSRPHIVHTDVIPPTSSVLTSWPPRGQFIVPVELVDPKAPFFYVAFIDYDPNLGTLPVIEPQESRFGPANTESRIRTLDLAIAEPLDPGRCHVIEVLVALQFNATDDSRRAHTPQPPGGDIVTWFYNPSGDLARCPTLDAGVDATFDTGPQ